MPDQNPGEWISVEEICALYDVTHSTLYCLLERKFSGVVERNGPPPPSSLGPWPLYGAEQIRAVFALKWFV